MIAGDGLSPPEAFVLLSLPRFDPRKAVKLGFMGLLAQGLLQMESEERHVMLRRLRIVRLHVADRLPARLPPPTESLLHVVRAAAPDGRMADVLKQCSREYGAGLTGFVRDRIVPALVQRGLAEHRPARILGLIPTTRYFRTAAGEAEKIRLDNAMRGARAIPRFLDRDPAEAVALAAALGGAILLVDELQPHYRAIADAMRQRGDGGDVAFSGDGGGGGFDFSFDFGSADFSSVDFGGFDAGFSDAGGDGGGGDGGGDGGSGC